MFSVSAHGIKIDDAYTTTNEDGSLYPVVNLKDDKLNTIVLFMNNSKELMDVAMELLRVARELDAKNARQSFTNNG